MHHHHRHHDHDAEGFHFIGHHRGGRGFGRFMSRGQLRRSRLPAPGANWARPTSSCWSSPWLAEKPRHGYEIIKALEERSRGFYAPSPGMVYPALTYLEEVGHATVVAEGAKKCYHLTGEGRAHLEQNREAVDAILSQLEQIGQRMEQVRRAFSGEQAAGEDEDGYTPGFGFGGYKGLWLARRELKAALHDKKFSGAEELERIAAILRKAAEEIRRK